MKLDRIQIRTKTFRIVILAALTVVVFQVSLGGFVRVTESGLGCPDWPLCHGQVIPPLVLETWIEWSHRLSASLLGLLIFIAFVVSWKYQDSNVYATASTSIGLILVVAAAVLGGVTVWTELEWWARLIHLGIAENVGLALIVALVATNGTKNEGTIGGWNFLTFLILFILLGTFVLIVAGSYIVGKGYSTSCSSWPLCNGTLFPSGMAFIVHMSHRYISVIVGMSIVGTVIAARSRFQEFPGLKKVILVVSSLFLVQTFIGAILIWSEFDGVWKITHLLFATLFWLSISYLAATTFIPGSCSRRISSSSGLFKKGVA